MEMVVVFVCLLLGGVVGYFIGSWSKGNKVSPRMFAAIECNHNAVMAALYTIKTSRSLTAANRMDCNHGIKHLNLARQHLSKLRRQLEVE